jgi:hypothetical protein
MRLLPLLLLAGFTASPVLAQSIPSVTAYDLNKKKIVWPDALAAQRTVMIIAFTRSQQAQVDGWVNGLNLKAPGAPAWFEVPLINDPGSVARWFIDNGMRSGIRDASARARVVTVYGNKAAMMKTMGLAGEDRVHAIVVDRRGKIMARASGAFSESGAAPILAALKP